MDSKAVTQRIPLDVAALGLEFRPATRTYHNAQGDK